MRPLTDSLKNKPWKDVRFENGSITPFKPNDLHQFRFRVHNSTIPISKEDKRENPESIIQPVLINKEGDGLIYEKPLLDELYQQQRYEQYVLADAPSNYDFNEFSHALYHNPKRGIWECHVFQNKKDVQIIELPPLLIEERMVAKFLLAKTLAQKNALLEHHDDAVLATLFPEAINAFLMKKTHYATTDNATIEEAHSNNNAYFFPHDQQVVCFSCTGSIPSKMNTHETIETDHSLVGIFRKEDEEPTTFLMIEKKDKNLCGRINVYQFIHTPKKILAAESLVIQKTPIHHEDYAQLTQAKLLQRYGLNREQVRARTFKVTQEKSNTLKELIKRDQQRVETKNLRYAARAGKILIETYGFLAGLFSGGLEYHNEASWCIGILIQANILNNRSELKYDREYTIPQPISWGTLFLGQTPNRVLPLPKKSTTPSHSGSGA